MLKYSFHVCIVLLCKKCIWKKCLNSFYFKQKQGWNLIFIVPMITNLYFIFFFRFFSFPGIRYWRWLMACAILNCWFIEAQVWTIKQNIAHTHTDTSAIHHRQWRIANLQMNYLQYLTAASWSAGTIFIIYNVYLMNIINWGYLLYDTYVTLLIRMYECALITSIWPGKKSYFL